MRFRNFVIRYLWDLAVGIAAAATMIVLHVFDIYPEQNLAFAVLGVIADPQILEALQWAAVATVALSAAGITHFVMWQAEHSHKSTLRLSRTSSTGPNRKPITDFLNDARKRGWDIDGKESLHILDLSKELRQAALDGVIKFWGKLVDSDFESIVRHKPLVEIPREHWNEFEIDAIGWRAASDNFNAKTYNPRQTHWGANGYADLNIDAECGEQWLKENPPTQQP